VNLEEQLGDALAPGESFERLPQKAKIGQDLDEYVDERA
jgi:hypothetical protein